MAHNIAHTAQHTARAHQGKGAKWPSTPHTQDNAPSEQTSEQEAGGPGHCTRKRTHREGTTMNRSKVAQETAHTRQRTERSRR